MGAAVSAPRLLAAYWTLAGQAMPRNPSQVSPFDFEARMRSAVDAGYRGVGLMADDVAAVAARIGLPAMRDVIRSEGLQELELEFLTDWFSSGERRALADARAAALLEAAQALGARHIKVGGDRLGAHWPLACLADGFAALCERARAHGVSIGLELLPWTQLDTVAQGLALLRAAGSPPNGGLLLDVWHLDRVGQDWAAIAALPADAICSVELSDAGPVSDSVWNDTILHRRCCGDGSIDLPGFIRAVHATGYQGPWGVEIISDAHRARTLDSAAHASYQSARAALAEAGVWH